jgi:hypothetical protein
MFEFFKNIRLYFKPSIADTKKLIIFTNLNISSCVLIYQIFKFANKQPLDNDDKYEIIIIIGEDTFESIIMRSQLLYLILDEFKNIKFHIMPGFPCYDANTNGIVLPTHQFRKHFDYQVSNTRLRLHNDIIKTTDWNHNKNFVYKFLDKHKSIHCICLKQPTELMDMIPIWERYNVKFYIYAGNYLSDTTLVNPVYRTHINDFLNKPKFNTVVFDPINGHQFPLVTDKDIIYNFPSVMLQYIQLINETELHNITLLLNLIDNLIQDIKDINNINLKKGMNRIRLYTLRIIDLFNCNKHYTDETKKIIINITTLFESFNNDLSSIYNKKYLKIRNWINHYNIIIQNNGIYYFNNETTMSLKLFPNLVQQDEELYDMYIDKEGNIIFKNDRYTKNKIITNFNYKEFVNFQKELLI